MATVKHHISYHYKEDIEILQIFSESMVQEEQGSRIFFHGLNAMSDFYFDSSY